MKEKIFLITGGLGFVGRNLTFALLNHDIRPIILDYIPEGKRFDRRYLPFSLDDVEFHNIDLTDRNAVLGLMRDKSPDFVVHLAAMTDLTKDFKSALISVEINIKGTLHLLESINNFPVSSFVFVSTSDVYGAVSPPFDENQIIIPASPYSVSKASAEMYCLMFSNVFDLPITILRSFNLFGKYQETNRVIPYIIQRLMNGQIVELTGGEQKREFNYVKNFIDAIFLCFKRPSSHGTIINVGTGESISIKDIAISIAKRFDLIDNLQFGAIPYRPNEIWDMYCDNTRAKAILGWEPRITVEEGINRTIDWFQKTFTSK